MTIRIFKRVHSKNVYLRNKQLMTRIVLIIMNIHEHSNTSKLKLIKWFLRKVFIFDTSPAVWQWLEWLEWPRLACINKKGIVSSLRVTRSDFTIGDNVVKNKARLVNLFLTYCLRFWLTSKIWLGWCPFSIFSQFSVFKCLADPQRTRMGAEFFLWPPVFMNNI